MAPPVRGCSGIRPSSFDALLDLLNHGVHAVIRRAGRWARAWTSRPSHTSRWCSWVKARPRRCQRRRGAPRRGPRAHRAEGGLAFIRTQPSHRVLALALHAPAGGRAADIAAALTIDALRGSVHPFEARIHAARPHAGQGMRRPMVLALLAGSAINASHADAARASRMRSTSVAPRRPHGADAVDFVARTVAIEMNSATDTQLRRNG